VTRKRNPLAPEHTHWDVEDDPFDPDINPNFDLDLAPAPDDDLTPGKRKIES
jgi:hypothetical protein